ncbi:MAG TPA: FlgD immunoglobulin-like domain containing protein, partial [Spirochaetia bacterium]|nr:FlgD immunoglobulin-like domain containing protein [Spirochaetia bacterium]
MLKSSARAITIIALFFAATTGLFALGSREVPKIQVENPSPWYLSPTGTSPTADHAASVTFNVTMSMKSRSGYIPEYSIAIDNSGGRIVRDIVKTQKPDLGFFARLFSARKSFTLQKTIAWDGKDNAGNVVQDGRYDATITVTAQDGTKRVTSLGTFVVDTQAPEVTISAPDGLVLNPKGDGKHTSLPIDQTDGTVENLWTGTFYNSQGDPVRTYTWKDSAPKSFAWDGRDGAGKLVPDGQYLYRITSTDEAGNRSQNYQIAGITLNTEQTPISLALSNPYFSPNGDGIKDSSTFKL